MTKRVYILKEQRGLQMSVKAFSTVAKRQDWIFKERPDSSTLDEDTNDEGEVVTVRWMSVTHREALRIFDLTDYVLDPR